MTVAIGRTLPFEVGVVRGEISRTTYAVVRGYNPDLGTGTAGETLWNVGGTVTWPTVASAASVVSTDATDSSAGTGARTVRLTLVNSDYQHVTEDVTLNGLTPVLTTGTNYIRVLGGRVLTAGNGGANAGEIRTSLGATLLMAMPVGLNNDRTGIYTVPAGYTAYSMGILFGAERANGTESVRGTLVVRPFGGVFMRVTDFEAGTISNSAYITQNFPIVATEKSDMYLQGFASAAGNIVHGRLDLLLVED